MVQRKLNLCRQIIHSGINVLLLSLLFSSFTAVNAQRKTGTEYEIYTDFDPAIALVIVILVCAFFLLIVFSMFIRHCSEPVVVANLSTAAIARNLSRRQPGLDSAVIEKFPVFFYSDVKEVKIGRGTLECAICLSEFEDNETLRLLPKCNHVFHPECIDKWLASHVTCPVCRGELTLESGETPKVSLTVDSDSNQEDIAPNLNRSSNEVAITVNEEQNRDSVTIIANTSQNPHPRSSISGKFPRSHSTGHSLVQGGANIERYTLRLPEEVRTQIMANAKLKRTLSFNVISTKEWSVRKGYKIGGEQIRWSERWSMLINPAFVSTGGGVKSSKMDKEGDSDSVNSRNLLAAVKLNCMSLKVEGVEEASTVVGVPV
ncbi:RING-H2 finger protein ATL32-like [Euphorbia lathyris]|uniref:RING-H2 finger protein ATL32-like n=1 Tax=Euphorbia lathyris TaxID=212925 RepID=UPI003313110C